MLQTGILLTMVMGAGAVPKAGAERTADPGFSYKDFMDHPWELTLYKANIGLICVVLLSILALAFFLTRKYLKRMFLIPAAYVISVSVGSQSILLAYLVLRIRAFDYEYAFTTDACLTFLPGLYFVQYTIYSVYANILLLEILTKLCPKLFRKPWVVACLTFCLGVISLGIDMYISHKSSKELVFNMHDWLEHVGKPNYGFKVINDVIVINQCRFDVLFYYAFYNGYYTFARLIQVAALILLYAIVFLVRKFCCKCCQERPEKFASATKIELVAEISTNIISLILFGLIAWSQSEIIKAVVLDYRHKTAWFVFSLASSLLLACSISKSIIFAHKHKKWYRARYVRRSPLQSMDMFTLPREDESKESKESKSKEAI